MKCDLSDLLAAFKEGVKEGMICARATPSEPVAVPEPDDRDRRVAELEAERDQLKADVGLLCAAYDRATANWANERDQMQADLAALRQLNTDLTEDAHQLAEERDQAQAEVKSLRAARNDAISRLAELREQRDQLQADLVYLRAAKETELTDDRDRRIAELTEDVRLATEGRNYLAGEHSMLQNEFSALRDEKTAADRRIAELKFDRDAWKESCARAQRAGRIAEVERERDAWKEDAFKAKKGTVKTLAELDKANQRIADLESLRAEQDKVHQLNTELKQERDVLKQTKILWMNECYDLRSNLDALRAEKEKADRRIAELVSNRDDLERHLLQYQDDVAVLRAERAKPHPLLMRVAEAGVERSFGDFVVSFTGEERENLRKELGL